MRLPGQCIVCRAPVIWTGKSWKAPGLGKGRRHECSPRRPLCGAWMPRARERCARRAGHVEGRGGSHHTRYAMDNLLRARGYVPMAERDPEWRYRDDAVVVR